MARTVIGYQGVGRARRAIYRDEGPARAGGGEGIAGRVGSALEKLADPDLHRDAVRQARAEIYGPQRVWRERDDRVRLARADVDHEEAVTAASFAWVDEVAHPSLEEEPAVMDTAVAAPEIADPTPDRLLRIDPPCARCVHAPVCWIRRDLETSPVEIRIPILQDGLSIGDWLSLAEVTCGYFTPERPPLATPQQARLVHALVDAEASAIRKAEVENDEGAGPGDPGHDVTRETAGDGATAARVDVVGNDRELLPGLVEATVEEDELEREVQDRQQSAAKADLTAKQARVLEILREEKGNQTKAGDRLGVTAGAVSSLVKGIRKRGRMPADVERLLEARAKYSAVGA